MKAINGPGIVIAVILAFILLLPKPKDNAAPGFSDVQHFFYYLIPLPVLMILAYKRIILDPSERRIRITKGVWPFLVPKEIPFEDSTEIQLDAMKGRWIAYAAHLSLTNQKKPILVFADGDEDQLRTILDFASHAGLRVQAKQGMKKFAPGWAREIIPELKQGS